MNNDVLMEILSRLPVPCLLRFRAVCKFWRDVIDSQFFMNLHTRSNNNNKLDDTVFLQFNLPLTDDRLLNVLSIRLQHNGKALMSYESDHFYDSNLYYACHDDEVRISKPVKGLICIYVNWNPFLGQLNILPLATSSCVARRLPWREVAIGFDVDYKVMQLYSCDADSCIHAQMYRRRTNTWEQLADQVISDVELISISRVPLLSPSYVFFSDGLCGHIVYDYRARKFIGRQYVEHVFVEYKGSFVSP